MTEATVAPVITLKELVPLKIIVKGDPSYEVGNLIQKDCIGDVEGTILDTEVLQHGAIVRLNGTFKDIAGRNISRIRVPPMHRVNETDGMIFITGIPLIANAIARAVMKNEPEGHIQRLVKSYQTKIVEEISGKNGVLGKGVFGSRMPCSGRFVVTPSIDKHPLWVGIHVDVMEKMGVVDGDYVIVGRDPVIWGGSIEVLKAYPISKPVARIHPLLFSQMGMDCDGDQIFVIAPDRNNEAIKNELASLHGRWVLANGRWPKMLCPDGMSDIPNWDDIENDSKVRFDAHAWTYSPKETIGKGKNVVALQEAMGKPFIEKNKKIALDIGNDELVLNTASAQMRMKRELGLVGSIGRRILVLAGNDPYLVKSANIVSERLQQLKLDAKHGEVLDAVSIFEMFERRGPWQFASMTKMATVLESAGIQKHESIPILVHIYVELPYQAAAAELCTDKHKLLVVAEALKENLRKDKPNLDAALDIVAEIVGAPKSVLSKTAKSNQVGLKSLYVSRYPFMAMIQSTDLEESIGLYHRTQIHHHQDAGGLFGVVLKSETK